MNEERPGDLNRYEAGARGLGVSPAARIFLVIVLGGSAFVMLIAVIALVVM